MSFFIYITVSNYCYFFFGAYFLQMSVYFINFFSESACITKYTQKQTSSCVLEKNCFLEILQISQENTCARVSTTLLKKRLWHSSFPANFAKFLRTPFVIELEIIVLLFSVFINWFRQSYYIFWNLFWRFI